MIEAIHESPEALRRTLETNEQTIREIVGIIDKRRIERLFIIGVGSSFTAAQMSLPVFLYHSRIPVHILPATDLGLYADRLVNQRAIVLTVSRSGERGRVIDALQDSRERGALTVGMTGSPGSLLAQKCDLTLVTGEGPESAFPKTKSVTACAGLLMRLGLALSPPHDAQASSRIAALRAVPEALREILQAVETGIRDLMPFIDAHHTLLVAGSGGNYGVALEAAVKVQEAAYITTLAADTGNWLHGPLSPLEPGWLVLALACPNDFQVSRELLKLAGRLGAHRLSITSSGVDLSDCSDHLLTLPFSPDPLLAPLYFLPSIQILAYYWTLARQRDPDRPEAMSAILEAILPPGRQEPESM